MRLSLPRAAHVVAAGVAHAAVEVEDLAALMEEVARAEAVHTEEVGEVARAEVVLTEAAEAQVEAAPVQAVLPAGVAAAAIARTTRS